MGEGVEKLKALLRLSRTGSGSGSLRAGSGSGRPWTPKLGRGKVGVAEDKHLSFLRGGPVGTAPNLPPPCRWPSSASWAARRSRR